MRAQPQRGTLDIAGNGCRCALLPADLQIHKIAQTPACGFPCVSVRHSCGIIARLAQQRALSSVDDSGSRRLVNRLHGVHDSEHGLREQNGYEFESDQELVASGLANIMGVIFYSFPTQGGLGKRPSTLKLGARHSWRESSRVSSCSLFSLPSHPSSITSRTRRWGLLCSLPCLGSLIPSSPSGYGRGLSLLVLVVRVAAPN